MVDVFTSLEAGVFATFIPLYTGLFTPRLLSGPSGNKPETRMLLAAASSGIILWFFSDILGDAARLNIDQGFNADTIYTHVLLALLFPVCLLALFTIERKASGPERTTPRIGTESRDSSRVGMGMTVSFVVAALAALAIGLHALGEGAIIGQRLTSEPTILDAIGGFYAGVAYVLHKVLEGFVIGAISVIAGAAATRKLGLLGLVGGLPTIIGFGIGIPLPSLDATYFFALGAAGAAYILLKLIPLFGRQSPSYAWVVALLLGFFSMYVAGLFHA